MKAKVLGNYYVIAFCKSCGAGFRVMEDPVAQGSKAQVAAAQTLRCPGCGHRAEYQPADIRVARYQKEGLGRRKGAKT